MDDVVDAVMTALDGPLVNGEIIQLVDSRRLTQNAVLAHSDPKGKTIRIPRVVVFALGKFSEFPFRLIGRQSPLSLYRLRSAMARRTFDCRRAEQLLGWHALVGIDKGIRLVLDGATPNLLQDPTEIVLPTEAEAVTP